VLAGSQPIQKFFDPETGNEYPPPLVMGCPRAQARLPLTPIRLQRRIPTSSHAPAHQPTEKGASALHGNRPLTVSGAGR
jgi:hypothetical protein